MILPMVLLKCTQIEKVRFFHNFKHLFRNELSEFIVDSHANDPEFVMIDTQDYSQLNQTNERSKNNRSLNNNLKDSRI